jgi:hypothetical protein
MCIFICCLLIIPIQSIVVGANINESKNVNKIASVGINSDIITMINQVNHTLLYGFLEDIVEFGIRYTGTTNCSLAAQYIYDEFQKMGLWVQFDNWKFGRFKSKNIVATLNGTDPDSDAIIIMCAHYDTVKKSPGALDNGAGVATVLTAAKIMSAYSFNHTIRFIMFSGEEVGLYGSYTYTKKAYEAGDNIYAVIDVDENGYAGSTETGNIIMMNHPERSNWVTDFSIDVSKKYMDIINLSAIPVPYLGWGDHAPFFSYGYDSVLYITSDFDAPWIHKQNDTLEKINHTYHQKTTKLLLAILAEFAIKPIDIQVRITSPYEDYLYLFDKPIRFMKIIPLVLKQFWYNFMQVPTILIGKTTVHADVKSKADIKYVVFCIDNVVIELIEEPPYKTMIKNFYNPPFSSHQLGVYAYDSNGKWSRDEMNIITLMASSIK